MGVAGSWFVIRVCVLGTTRPAAVIEDAAQVGCGDREPGHICQSLRIRSLLNLSAQFDVL